MHYLSTRGKGGEIPSAVAILEGLAPDGGLYVPEEIPRLGAEEFSGLAGFPYPERAARLLSFFLTDYDEEELRRYARAAYGPDRFDNPAVTPLVPLDGRTSVVELWHGPTAAFKDLALQIMPHLLRAAVAKTGSHEEVVILVATSGDTGKAALEGFRDVPGTKIVVFYPAEGVSRVQELQMTTQEGGNVAVVAVEGNFDDAQTGVKAIFADPELKMAMAARGLRFSSANSINWGRLVPQIAYYVTAYLEMAARGAIRAGDPINIAVPTGNFGNILAAYYARALGLPVARLVCASNMNNVLTDFLRTGVYDRRRNFYTTISPSMDILISSNLERLLFLLADRDPGRVTKWMADLKETGRYELDPGALRRLQEVFWGGYADEEETKAAIGRVWRECGYLLAPHTAVGWHVLEEYRRTTGDPPPTVLAATASPFKFPAAVLEAITGEKPHTKNELGLVHALAAATGRPVPVCLRGLETRPIRHNRRCRPEGMKEEVEKILGLNGKR
ncbi:MAG: threonine synthase [Firmicutes bacterium]|nr:threonine synthase [Bacillota bacterium]